MCRLQNLIQLFFVQDSFLQDKGADGFACLHSGLGNLRGLLVSDVRADGGNDSNAVLDKITAAAFVGGNSGDTVVDEGLYCVGQCIDGLEHAVEDDRFKCIQFKLSGFRSHGDGHIIADDVERYLVYNLRDDRIHLTRHDGGTVLPCRQVDLCESGSGTG